MSSQLIGFSIGGIARRFLVAPPSMSNVFFAWIDRPSLMHYRDFSLAENPRLMCALQHTALTDLRRDRPARRNQQRAILYLRLWRCCTMV